MRRGTRAGTGAAPGGEAAGLPGGGRPMSDQGPIHPELRYHTYASYLRRRFGGPVARIAVDGGFTCPNRDGARGTGGCAYCNNDAFSPVRGAAGVPVEEQVRRALAVGRRGRGAGRVLVYFQRFSGSYGAPERLERAYRAAFCDPAVVGIVIGTRPDCLGPDVLEVIGRLAKEHYVSVELGLQSMSDDVLSRINRGHTVRDFASAVPALRALGIDVAAHVINGLPGDSPEGFASAAPFLSGLGVCGVKLHHFHVVRGSGIEEAWRSGGVAVPDYGDHVRAAAEFIGRLSPQAAVLRLVASAPRDLLLAPLWRRTAGEAARDVAAELARRGIRQGDLAG